GAVWWAHPRPLPNGFGAKNKKLTHVWAFFFAFRVIKTPCLIKKTTSRPKWPFLSLCGRPII
ncbi:hypothetical protein, partial [Enterobacter intestinihominis]